MNFIIAKVMSTFGITFTPIPSRGRATSERRYHARLRSGGWKGRLILTGRLMMDSDLDAMLAEMNGPCNFDNMLRCFEAKMAGGVNDPDDLVINAFKVYDEEISETVKGVTTVKHIIDKETFRHILMSFGDKMTAEEIDDIFEEFDYDDETGGILTRSAVDLFVAGGMDEKEEEKKEDEKAKKEGEDKSSGESPAANPAPEGGAKKKKKKKKAAK